MSDALSRPSTAESEILLVADSQAHRPSLESRVAYQWRFEGDLIGHRTAARRNQITLDWMEAEVRRAGLGQAAALDVGCAYGNMLLMLNARLGKPATCRIEGVDLHPPGVMYGNAFAGSVPGYGNCRFQVCDLTKGLPFDDASFDVVNMGDVLEHMDDPAAALREIRRVMRADAALILSTPVMDSLFKRLARLANCLSGGRLYQNYYKGKDTELNEHGEPVMKPSIGNDHVSEMPYNQLIATIHSAELRVEKERAMPILSGSKWFDRHPFLMTYLLWLEALHDVMQFRSWGHSTMLVLRKAGGARP
jgi:SAM-dependent methyltransferase